MENLVSNLEWHDAEAVSASTILREVGNGDRPATTTDTVVEPELRRVHAADEAFPLRLEGHQALLCVRSLRDQVGQLGLDNTPLLGQRLVHLY